MTEHEVRLYDRLLPRTHAAEVLRDRGGSLSSEQLHRLMLLAGADKLEAAKAAARRALDETRRRG